ncbi:MAG: HDOD domain-containing protein [Planctomycetota bacterium]
MKSDFLEKALGNQVSIPTLPVVVERINRMMLDPEVGLRELGKAIAQDAPIATKVLRIANSAFYGLREKVVSTEHAASVLGLRVLKNLVLQASVISKFEHLSKNGVFDLDAQWKHSIVVGHLCQELTRSSSLGFALAPDEFYSCGLLHDIGKVVLLDNLGADYVESIKRAQKAGRPLFEIEDEDLGFDHSGVGARVAQHWGLPEVLVTAIGRHHEHLVELLREEPAAAVVHVANTIAHRLLEEGAADGRTAIAAIPLSPLGLEPVRTAEVVEGVRQGLSTMDF